MSFTPYKILCIINEPKYLKKVEGVLLEYRNYIWEKFGLEAEIEWKTEVVSEPLKWIYSKPYFGLDFNTTNRFSSEAVGFHSIWYFYKPETSIPLEKIASWTYTLGGKPQVQIRLDAEPTLNLVKHEGVHSFFQNLSQKGVKIDDTTDAGLPMELENEISVLKPYWKKICEPMPIDTVIGGLLSKIAKLKEQIISFGGRRTFRQLAEAMAKIEGFYIAGSRASRNRNPLNIKWASDKYSKYIGAISKDDKNFCIFPDSETGFNGCIKDIKVKAGKNTDGWKTGTGLTGNSTIAEFIRVWSATDQESYIKFVSTELKLAETYKIGDFV